ncbi:adenylate kinase [Dehalococcoides mccartyi]|uniref:Adenylate kinase n=1 Tax=Dehalococcoides mccartyi TaxID=61435 RepID=A0A328ES99_9CHLR|nr:MULTISPECIES: adenylate kinase [Dehalococcoides]AGG06133.1 adenylate kinase [Dehalococcoides mccartyi DCMB5]RAL69482.1 adenylate kinase [Dehalococcoides mccartyi]RAL70796.1 adenylate kinase [Dehalococcoides mccartyi]
MYNIIFLGAPGSGKGTQGEVVAKELKLAHMATGDLFRKAIECGDELGDTVKSYMERGELVPDEITISVVLKHLAGLKDVTGIILDGFPRSLRQAEALDEALVQQGQGIGRVIYINVPEDELVRRLSGRWVCRSCQSPYQSGCAEVTKGKCSRCQGELYQRPDDTPETVKERLKVYFSKTAPLIEYYRSKGKLSEIDGMAEISEVTKRIISAIKCGK